MVLTLLLKYFMSLLQEIDVDEPSTCVGQPKGATAADIMSCEERIELAMKEAKQLTTRKVEVKSDVERAQRCQREI